VSIAVDDGGPPFIEIGRPTLTTVFDGTTHGDPLLAIEAATPDLSLVSATFR
jgi:hypothetical protein